jgi:hypothetical protein
MPAVCAWRVTRMAMRRTWTKVPEAGALRQPDLDSCRT